MSKKDLYSNFLVQVGFVGSQNISIDKKFEMEKSLPLSIADYVISEWKNLNSKPLFSTADVRGLVEDISGAVEKMLDLTQIIQKPNYAIIGARGTGKTWLMHNMNILLNKYFEEHNFKAHCFYSDMSQPLQSLQSPFDRIQAWLIEQDCDFHYKGYDQALDWLRCIKNKGFRFFFFADEIHHVYECEIVHKLKSMEIIYQLQIIGKSTCSLGFISSSSYKLTKYAFKDIPLGYSNLNSTVYTKKNIYPLRDADRIAEYCYVDLNAAAGILWHTGGVPRYMNSPNELPISKSDFWTYIDESPLLASVLTIFYLRYNSSNPFDIITLKWPELFTNQCLPGEYSRCIEEYSESYFFHSIPDNMEIQLLLPYTITYIVEYFSIKSAYLKKLVFILLTEKKFISMGHYMESVILKNHSEGLDLGVYREQGTILTDGVYQMMGANDIGLDGFIVNGNIIDIIQVKCGDKNKEWTDGYRGKIPKENRIGNIEIVAIKGKSASNMKNVLVKAARNWQSIKAKYPGFTLGKFYFITTQIVGKTSLELAKNTWLFNEKILDVVVLGYQDIKRVIYQ